MASASVLLLLGGLWSLSGPGSSGGDPSTAHDGAAGSRAWPDRFGVPITSYHRYDGRHVAIDYTIGVPECYGEIAEPRVVETRRSVTVTLTRVPPAQPGTQACIEIALVKSVDIELATDLGDRAVLDGSAGRTAVPERRKAPAGGPAGASQEAS